MLFFLLKLFQQVVVPLVVLLSMVIMAISGAYLYYTPQLPSVKELHKIQLTLPIRVYSREDKLIAEFGQYRRRLVKINNIPQSVIDAFVAIEDARFYQHRGVDLRSMARAVVVAAKKQQLTQGASTITMQLARNYFLTSERTLSRKIKEIFLAIKIENNFTKADILEFYLNKIFLGKHAYGIAAAAEVYYGKKLNQLTLAQTAMIAGLPKAPTKYNPINNPRRAKQRRDYILMKMWGQHYITANEYDEAIKEKVSAKIHVREAETYAPYLAEMVRAEVMKRYGNVAYKLGLNIYTTLDSEEQALALSALRSNLLKYSHRHGYRGAEGHLDVATLITKESISDKLNEYKTYAGIYPALVLNVNQNKATLKVNQQIKTITLTLSEVNWARRYINENRRGKKIRRVSDVLKKGDIVRVQKKSDNKWQLTQIPRVTGALVSLDPNDGAIRAIAGGFDFSYSKFNRATQAKRQPGSSFKPFIYSAALAKGSSPASIVNDAPLKLKGSSWNPQNFGHKFGGLTRLRVALAKSKNLVSIHLLQKIGISYAIDYATKFGFKKETLPRNLTIALGTGSVTPLEMATAYATFANGGYKIDNYFIRKIEDKDHKLLFKAKPKIACPSCPNIALTSKEKEKQRLAEERLNNHKTAKELPLYAERIMQPYVNYQITSMLQEVARVGTAARAGRTLKRSDIAGKTGTTNDQKDAWFCGFTPKKVTTVWVGFDHVAPLGKRETSTRAALPVWIDFMKVALKDTKVTEFPRPKGLVDIKLDARTGSRPTFMTSKTIIESLMPEQIPAYTKHYNYMRVAKGKGQKEKGEKLELALQQQDFLTKLPRSKRKLVASQSLKRTKQIKKWQQRSRNRKITQRRKKIAKRQRLRQQKRQKKKKAELVQQQTQRPIRRPPIVRREPPREERVEIPEQLF
jgi:penicillin-binding protein 1A